MSELLECSGDNPVSVNERGKKALAEISSLLSVFEPVDQTGKRGLWLELPPRYGRSSSLEWYYISVTSVGGSPCLEVTQNEGRLRSIIGGNDRYGGFQSMAWILRPIINYLREKLPEITGNIDSYNKYVEETLPYRQRVGRISRKDLYRIAPDERITVRNQQECIQVLKASVNHIMAPETETHSYSEYYHIAAKAYRDYYGALVEDDSPLFLSPCYEDELGYDMPEDCLPENSQWEELGISGITLYLSEDSTSEDWFYELNIGSYYNIDVGMQVAIALYDSGCPFVIHNARKLLDLLEGNGDVTITSNEETVFPDTRKERSIFSLPQEYELDHSFGLTREQYNEIISLATWEKPAPLVLSASG